jgi:hypothetical protein
MVHRGVPTILLLLALCGCAAGPGAAPEVVPAGMAQINVTRPSEWLYASVKATVEVNGARVADIARDDGYAASIQAGRTTVSAFAASPPGRYTVTFNAESGKTYRLVVTPRREGYIPPAGSGSSDFTVTENDGAFKIAPGVAR